MTTSTMPYGWGRVPFDYESRLPWRNLPFPEEEYEQRIARLRLLMAAEEMDGVIVVGTGEDSANIRYLANFQDFYGGETVLAVPAEGEVVMVTNAVMHGEPMHSGIADAWPRDVRAAASPRTVTGSARPMTLEDHVKDALSTLPANANVGIAGRAGQMLIDRLDVGALGWTTKPATQLIIQLRSIKSDREVEVLRKAASIADAGAVAAMESVAPGVTEFDIAAAANDAMFRAGAEHPAFAISVVAGPRSGLKHAAPTAYAVKPGDIAYVDLGGRYMGYLSDSSRQTVCGEPSREQLRMMETQIAIVETVSAGIKPGTVIGDMAAVASEMAEAEGYADYLYFRGHGIGTGFDDRPALAPNSPHTWDEGMVFCLEPMLIRHGFGTACWEDMWHVTADGCERLNRAPYRFWSVP
jgi:Xaa-Pro aminopeptidase